MSAILLINAALALAITAALAYGFFTHFKNKKTKAVMSWLSLATFGYLLLVLMFILWSVNALSFSSPDMVNIFAGIITFQVLVFFNVVYHFARSRLLVYVLVLYIVSVVAIIFLFARNALFLLAVDYFVMLLLVIPFLRLVKIRRRAAHLGLAYGFISLVLTLLSMSGNLAAIGMITATNIIFLSFIIFFVIDASHLPTRTIEARVPEKNVHLTQFTRYFVFIFVITSLILISTIGVHELGHVAAAGIIGCTSSTILYEQGGYPHTEVLCPDDSGERFVSISGIVLPFLITIIIFLVGGKFMKDIALIGSGFNFLASFNDLLTLGLSLNIAVVLTIVGLFLFVAGIVLLARSRMEDHTFPFMHEMTSLP